MLVALVDTETTGLDPTRHRVIEAGVLLVELTKEGVKTIASPFVFRQKVSLRTTQWSPGAFKVNKYFEGHPDWEYAPDAGSEIVCANWQQLADVTEKAILCSQNIEGFDKPFMTMELERFDIKPKWDRRSIELMSFSAFVAVEKNQPKFPLHDIYTALGGPPLEEHRALADIMRGKFVLEHFHKRYFTA